METRPLTTEEIAKLKAECYSKVDKPVNGSEFTCRRCNIPSSWSNRNRHALQSCRNLEWKKSTYRRPNIIPRTSTDPSGEMERTSSAPLAESVLNESEIILRDLEKSLDNTWLHQNLKEAIQKQSWSTLNGLTDECAAQWADAHINLPQIVPVIECFQPKPPGAETIFQLIFEKVRLGATDYSMFDGGVSDVDQAGATYMLMAYPDISKPQSFLMNIPIKSTVIPQMIIPERLLPKYQPTRKESRPLMLANLTPRGVIVDPHLDGSRDSLIAVIGSSKKLTFMWPGSTSNIQLLRETERTETAFIDALTHLTGCIAQTIDASSALWMPAGIIHGVITEEGGVLIGINTQSICGYIGAIRAFAR
ncbi:hypothetical protein B0A52_08040 [Exophiala mesophila]|uniref:JmjC domain-containing protein n=1 Tax=Exophiala mesophila TaxID=212818 RepID=A0A438MZ14_EXOME|nr:hypothetical protein B0A52_08040 [Exophiala mesophila]